jgi:squalene-associated FAD-dependent desaturase
VDRLADLGSRVSAKRVGIVGAGWAGLATAVHLSQHDVRPVIFEASRNLGGRARSLELEGKTLDNGQHILIGAYRESLQLMRTVGVDTAQAFRRLPLSIHNTSGFALHAPSLPAPLNILWGLSNARGLRWRERGAALRFAGWLRARRYRLPVDEPLSALLARHQQSATLQRELWGPLCVAALNTPVERASAQIFSNVLRDSLGAGAGASALLLPRRALGALFPQPATQFIQAHQGEIHLGHAVREISIDEGALKIDGQCFDAIVLAGGPQHIPRLLPAAPSLDALRATLTALQYEPIYSCYLQYSADTRLEYPMLGFGGNSDLLQWAFDRGQLDGHAGLIAAVISAHGAHENIERADLIEGVERELRSVLPRTSAPLWTRIVAERRATFSCRPGVQRPDNRTAHPGLYLAGDYTRSDYPATLESAVRSGLRAASLALAHLNAQSR